MSQKSENEAALRNPATELPKYPQGDKAAPRYPAGEKFPKNPSGRPAGGNPKSTTHIGKEGPG
jgi:hypothetical protein